MTKLDQKMKKRFQNHSNNQKEGYESSIDDLNEDQSEKNGRWTTEEHDRFIQALKLYGKDYQKIEEHVGTRSAPQIRSHTQKFFHKLTRSKKLSSENAHLLELM